MDLNYEIIRSARRQKLTITVERDCSVIVHAPLGTSDETIRQVVDSRRQWIFEKINHPQKYQCRPPAPGKEVVSGESVAYLGRGYPIEITQTKSGGVEFSNRFFIPPTQAAERREVLKQWYLTRASEVILPRVRQQANELGVSFGEAKIVDNRYRWGSCTVKSRVNFNWRLIKAPMFVIDYVIVHELAHLREANHSPRFWNIVRAKVPFTDKAKTWLKDHGKMLEEDLTTL